MATRRQELAARAEVLVVGTCRCLRCDGAFRPLRRSTPAAVIRCVECGALAQVRARRGSALDGLPRTIMGGEWGPQARLLLEDRLHDLFVVLVGDRDRDVAVHALPGSAQTSRLFRTRMVPASPGRGAGGLCFTYDLEAFWPLFTKAPPRTTGWPGEAGQVVRAFPSAPRGARAAATRPSPAIMRASVGPATNVVHFAR